MTGLVRGHYGETMKNRTVSLDDETYRRARTIAAQRDTSVSPLVKSFLLELTSGEVDPLPNPPPHAQEGRVGQDAVQGPGDHALDFD